MIEISISQKYTYPESRQADALIQAIVSDVAMAVQDVVPEDGYHALVLIGGYGRGEGGVRQGREGERPNNNLDFLLISRDASKNQLGCWQQAIVEQVQSIQEQREICIDFSVIAGDVLRRSDCRVMWYDMRWGHKTILGDIDFVPSMTRFKIDRIPNWDIHNLLVNRGTLLVINDCLEASGTSPEHALVLTRHTIKAVIGYGDALLYSVGQYHWSYVEKQSRMRALDSISKDFQTLYDTAASFRFRPQATLPTVLQNRQDIRRQCESVHLLCESKRLGRTDLNWDNYLETALSAGVWEDLSPLGWARSIRNACQSTSLYCDHDQASMRAATRRWRPAVRIGLRALSVQRLLGILFPAVAYPSCSDLMRCDAASLLNARDSSMNQLRKAYLRVWGQVVDRNFSHFLDRIGLSLESQESAS